MNYTFSKTRNELLIIEDHYNPLFSRKSESILTQGNGYLGIRNSYVFGTVGENRGMFVAGLYNKSDGNSTAELVNCPDVTMLKCYFNNTLFVMNKQTIEAFRREFDIYSGETRTEYQCRTDCGIRFGLEIRKFASSVDLNLFVQKIKISFYDSVEDFRIVCGIDGHVCNSGVSHLKNIKLRVYDKTFMESLSHTKTDDLKVITATDYAVDKGSRSFFTTSRSIFEESVFSIKGGESLELTRYSLIDADGTETNKLLENLKKYAASGYTTLYSEHRKNMENFWIQARLNIEGNTLEEEVKINFSLYHLFIMVPRHSDSVSIGAKGLSGEGYCGHVFWDTEIYLLPFYTCQFPEFGRNLLAFRYRGIQGAQKKAEEFGYRGTMYPWEVAKDGMEETPLYSALNIHSGERTRIYSGLKEHHITADIAFAAINFYKWTGDRDFMVKSGFEILFNCADFWVSRSEKSGGKIVINDVIGPDEYTEHVDNNAYTNYMAHFIVTQAVEHFEQMKRSDMVQFRRFDGRFGSSLQKWKDFAREIYLPETNSDGIIPQDDTFLQKPEIPDIQKYRESMKKQSVLAHYSREEVVAMQVLKQADLALLFNLLPHLFDEKTILENVDYYEKRTIHDSSLSYCSYAEIYGRLNELEKGFSLFKKALSIDLNENPFGSTDGIHAAGQGGIWNIIMFGFLGIEFKDNVLTISPSLPEHWTSIGFNLKIKGMNIQMVVDKSSVTVRNKRSLEILLQNEGLKLILL